MSRPHTTRNHLPLATVFLQFAALSAMAVAQPLLQLVKENPEFLTVHHAQGADVLLLAAALLLVPPALLTAMVLLTWLPGREIGRLVHTGLLGGLVTLILLPIVDRMPVVAGWATLGLAIGAGVAFAVGFARSSFIRDHLAIVALVVPVFLALFLGSGPIRGVLVPASSPSLDHGQTTAIAPVVVVIFDELPSASLMGPDGELDCQLFPNFCRLASRSTWYRNATSISGATLRSVPAILSGQMPRWKDTPSLADHPDNLFTLLSSSHRISAVEVQTSLCPEELVVTGKPPLHARVELLLVDLGILYQHVVVPERWRQKLVPVADKWGNFLGSEKSGAGVVNGSTRLTHITEFIDSLEAGDRPGLVVVHTLLPHSPFQFLPDGRFYNRGRSIPSLPDHTWGVDTEVIAHSYRRHLLQLVAVDRLVGRLLDRLEELDMLDEAVVVVTADHGISFRAGLHRRQYRPGNEADIMFVPLFIKTPGQTTGAIDDRFVQSLDIMPTVASALGVELPWEHAGHDLLTEPIDRANLLFMDQDAYEERHFGLDIREDRDEVIAWKHELFGTDGGVERLFEAYDPGQVIGREVDELTVRPHGSCRARILDRQRLEKVDLSGSFVPAEINGLIEGHAGPDRLSLALAVNGAIAGASLTYLDGPDPGIYRWQITVPPDVFRDGANEVELFVVDPVAAGADLLRVPLDSALATSPSFLHTNLGGQSIEGVDERGLFASSDWKGTPARWTDGAGRWTIPIKDDEYPKTLVLGFVSSGPPGAELTVTVNGTQLLRQFLPRGDWETRLPLDRVEIGRELTVVLESTVFVPADVQPGSTDRRELGVAVRTLVVK